VEEKATAKLAAAGSAGKAEATIVLSTQIRIS
jgi:hypothetical protein